MCYNPSHLYQNKCLTWCNLLSKLMVNNSRHTILILNMDNNFNNTIIISFNNSFHSHNNRFNHNRIFTNNLQDLQFRENLIVRYNIKLRENLHRKKWIRMLHLIILVYSKTNKRMIFSMKRKKRLRIHWINL